MKTTHRYVLSLLPGIKIRAGQWTMSGLKLCSPVMFTSHANPHSLTNCQIHVLTLNLGFFSFFTRMQIKNFTRISKFFPNILTSQLRDKTEYNFLWPDTMSGHHPKNKLLRALHEMQNTTCCLLTSQPFHTSQISVNQNKTAKLLNNDNNLTIIITFLKVDCKARYLIFKLQ